MKVEDDLPDWHASADAGPLDGGAGDAAGSGDTGAIIASGFRDFLLRQDIMQGIVACGFEHPSEVQHACIPQAVLGTDILCQAKSGMGKTAVFVLACLQNVERDKQSVRAVVLCHSRELAHQIEHEFKRLGKFTEGLKVASISGGTPVDNDRTMLKKSPPHILVSTPGRLKHLVMEGACKMDDVTHFIVDECDRCIDDMSFRRDIQQIFVKTPRKKQVMMFSATIGTETRVNCKKFMQTPHEITVESEAKLTLHGLLQYYVKLEEKSKNRKLVDLLDALEFNQVVIFVSSVKRALALDGLLNESNFPSMTLHDLPKAFEHKSQASMVTGGRIDRLKAFKDFRKRILVTTDLFGRGMDVERINIVINYDMPKESDMYLHRVGRTGRFGTKGLAITFSSSDADEAVLKQVQSRFEVNIGEMPATIDTTSYLNA